MDCLIVAKLVKDFEQARKEYSAAVRILGNLLAVPGNDQLLLSQAYKRANQKNENCQRTRSAVAIHRTEHRCR
jgi:hypothetical protein